MVVKCYMVDRCYMETYGNFFMPIKGKFDLKKKGDIFVAQVSDMTQSLLS